MSGFCPHEWHGTTEDDLQQMAAGEYYWMFADSLGWGGFRPFGVESPAYRAARRREYAIHDAAIAQAKSEGLRFDRLPAADQNARMDAAEAALLARPFGPRNGDSQ